MRACFVALDGKVFDKEEECKEYEAELQPPEFLKEVSDESVKKAIKFYVNSSDKESLLNVYTFAFEEGMEEIKVHSAIDIWSTRMDLDLLVDEREEDTNDNPFTLTVGHKYLIGIFVNDTEDYAYLKILDLTKFQNFLKDSASIANL